MVSICRLYGVHTGRGGIASSSPRSGGALTSVPDVFVARFSKARNRVNSSVCTVSPPQCVVLPFSVLIQRLCLAEKHAGFAEALLGN